MWSPTFYAPYAYKPPAPRAPSTVAPPTSKPMLSAADEARCRAQSVAMWQEVFSSSIPTTTEQYLGDTRCSILDYRHGIIAAQFFVSSSYLCAIVTAGSGATTKRCTSVIPLSHVLSWSRAIKVSTPSQPPFVKVKIAKSADRPDAMHIYTSDTRLHLLFDFQTPYDRFLYTFDSAWRVIHSRQAVDAPAPPKPVTNVAGSLPLNPGLNFSLGPPTNGPMLFGTSTPTGVPALFPTFTSPFATTGSNQFVTPLAPMNMMETMPARLGMPLAGIQPPFAPGTATLSGGMLPMPGLQFPAMGAFGGGMPGGMTGSLTAMPGLSMSLSLAPMPAMSLPTASGAPGSGGGGVPGMPAAGSPLSQSPSCTAPLQAPQLIGKLHLQNFGALPQPQQPVQQVGSCASGPSSGHSHGSGNSEAPPLPPPPVPAALAPQPQPQQQQPPAAAGSPAAEPGAFKEIPESDEARAADAEIDALTAGSAEVDPEALSVVLNPARLTFGLGCRQAPVDVELTETLTATNPVRDKASFRIVQRASEKCTLSFEPTSGTLSGGKSMQITARIRVHCTTANLSPEVLIVAWRGSARDVDGRSSRRAFAKIAISLESQLTTMLDKDEITVFGAPIGDGSYGTVWRGQYRGLDVAVKILKRQEALTEASLDEFHEEVEMMEKLRHPAVINFIGAVRVPGHLAIVTEFCEYGSMNTAIRKKQLDWPLKLKCLLDCARGMDFLHRSNIMHRDLKPDNLLMVSMEVRAPVVCKISDFGTTRAVNRFAEDIESTRGVGTPIFMAPEVMNNKPYEKPADVYSFAMMMYNVVADKHPYSDDNDIKQPWQFAQLIIQGKRPKIDPDWPDAFTALMVSGWSRNPAERPSFSDLVVRLDEMLKKEMRAKDVPSS